MPEEYYNEFKKNSTIRDEYKTKAEVKAQEIMKSLNLGNSSRIANQVRNKMAVSVQSSNARQGGK